MDDHAKRYLSIAQEQVDTIWWKLFNSPSSKNWVNILSLVELIYCLPMSNGHIEYILSPLKMIKTDGILFVKNILIMHVLRIGVDGPPLSEWSSSGAIQLWWQDKQK